MSEAAWTTDDIGDLTGRTAVVTGPTLGGLGFHTALELARHGARVVLAGRTTAKLDATAEAIAAMAPLAAMAPMFQITARWESRFVVTTRRRRPLACWAAIDASSSGVT